jgi:hypothetical protein
MAKINQVVKKDGKIIKTQIEAPKTPVYSVRIRSTVYEELVMIAARNSRSITQEINHRLERSLDR